MTEYELSTVEQYKAMEKLAKELANKELEYCVARFRRNAAYDRENMTLYIEAKKQHLNRMLELRRLEIIVKNKGMIISPITGLGGMITQSFDSKNSGEEENS